MRICVFLALAVVVTAGVSFAYPGRAAAFSTLATWEASEFTHNIRGEKQIMEPPSQPPPPAPGSDKNGRDATAEVESPHPSEGRRASLDTPKKDINWQFIGVIVAIFFGSLGFKNSCEAAEEFGKFAEITAEAAAKNLNAAAETAERVQRDPAASPIARTMAAAVLLHQQGNIKEAIKKWNSIADSAEGGDRQRQARAWFSIGYLRGVGERTPDLGAALNAYTRAIQLDPNFADAYNNRGSVKKELGQPAAAIADYDRAIALNPALARAYYNRGNAKAALGQPAAAIADHDRAIELNPGWAEAYTNRGTAKATLGQPAAAIADHDRAIELNPGWADAYYNRGNAKKDFGQPAAAIADYDRTIELNLGSVEAYTNRGTAKATLGQHAAAIADYDRAIALNPALARVYYNRGNAKAALGQPAAAIADHDRAIELNPAWADAYYNRGNVKKELGQDAAAIADYDRAIALNSTLTAAYINRGAAKVHLCRISEARDDLQKARALAQESGDAGVLAVAENNLMFLNNKEEPCPQGQESPGRR